MLRSRHVFACGPGSSPSGRPNGGAQNRNFSARSENCFLGRNCGDRQISRRDREKVYRPFAETALRSGMKLGRVRRS
jgi:hypothetical protein